ncbi:MAG: DUF4180 domain-containing protein [Bacteroidota bacterium]|jgi:hypothetical protein
MKIEIHKTNGVEIAEIIADELLITSTEDGSDLAGSVYFQGYNKVIIYEKNIIPAFFDLKTGIAGEVLQKFSNFRIRLAVVGNWSLHTNVRIQEFISESNKFGHINFAETKEEAVRRLQM